MAKRSTVLKVAGLRRAYGENTIFDKFNLEVRTGEAIALTGRNGSGKSTLLRCLVGADRPDDGSIEVFGQSMVEASPQIRRDMATVIDDLDFFPDLSVVEHLDLLARAHGLEDPDEMVDAVLEEVQLVPQSGQLPGTLSSGQRRRLALATAFVRPRKLLVMDEPEQRLDTEGVNWLAGRLKAERSKGLAIVFASHEPTLVETVATRVVELGGAARMSSLDAAEANAFDQPDEPDQVLRPARVGELKGLIKDWRRGRATKSLWEAFHDAYIAVIAALMIGAMVINVVLKAQGTMSQCSSETCLSARTVLPWAAFALAVSVTLAASRLFGPVLASAAEGFWILDAPVNRKRLLVPRFVAALVLAALVGAVIGGLVSALTGASPVAIAVWAGATALSGTAAVAFAAAQQGREKHRLTQVIGLLFSLLGVAALVLVIGIAAQWFTLGLSTDVGVELGLIVSGVAAVVLVVGLVLTLSRLGSMRRVRLTSGGSLIRGISGAFFALDIGLARDIVVARRAVEIGQVRPRRGRGVGLQAIIWREWQRLVRFPQPLLFVAGSVVVPYAADALGMSTLTPVLAGLTLFGALVGMLGGLRVLTRTGGLARCLPFSLSQLKLASIAVPAGVVVLWAIATTPAYLGFGDGAVTRDPFDAALMSTATGTAGLLAAVRWTQAKAVDFGAPMVSTQAGAFPPGLMTNLFRGFDVCLIVTAPMLLGFSPLWSFAIAAIAALILLNSMDAETMRARQAEQQKQLAAQKKQREAANAVDKQRKR